MPTGIDASTDSRCTAISTVATSAHDHRQSPLLLAAKRWDALARRLQKFEKFHAAETARHTRETEERCQRRAAAVAARAAKVERPLPAPGQSHPGRHASTAVTTPPTADERAKETVRQARSKDAVAKHQKALQAKEQLRQAQNAARHAAIRKDWELLHAG